MGGRGPAPKRPEERVRRHKPDTPITVVDVAKLIRQDVEIPEPNPKWHEGARELFDSFAHSGQAVYYEPSDWQVLKMTCENLSRLLKPQYVGQQFDSDGSSNSVMKRMPLKGADMTAILKSLTMLGATEPDRRRAGIIIERAVHATDMNAVEGSGEVIDMFADRDEALGG